MNRPRIQGGAGGTGAKNSVLPPMGSGKGTPKPVNNSIAVRPGSASAGTVGNSIALGKGKTKKGGGRKKY